MTHGVARQVPSAASEADGGRQLPRAAERSGGSPWECESHVAGLVSGMQRAQVSKGPSDGVLPGVSRLLRLAVGVLLAAAVALTFATGTSSLWKVAPTAEGSLKVLAASAASVEAALADDAVPSELRALLVRVERQPGTEVRGEGRRPALGLPDVAGGSVAEPQVHQGTSLPPVEFVIAEAGRTDQEPEGEILAAASFQFEPKALPRGAAEAWFVDASPTPKSWLESTGLPRGPPRRA
jgi:hypothetical protein